MPRISIDNYDTVATWNGDSDLFIVEQPDGTKVATPNMVRQFMESFYDDVPIEGSERAVKSGGIFSTMGVPCIDPDTGKMYLKGGAAFGGNIDSSPTAGSNNAVASGGTKAYVDNAINVINAALGNLKIAIIEQTFSGYAIDRAWGSVYESSQRQIDISSLNLSSPPKAVYLTSKSSTASVLYEMVTPTAGTVPFYFVRPNNNGTNITTTVSALVVY